MDTSLFEPPAFIKLLANDVRWTLLQSLVSGDHRVQELVALAGQPTNLVSYHLKKLREEGVVQMRRSEADARDIYYSLNLDRLHEQYQAAGRALHPAFAGADETPPPAAGDPIRVLFVCTHNSARSQMAEGLTRYLAGARVEAHSAGSHPGGIHPDTITTMARMGIDIGGQHAKHLSEFEAQPFDYVITVCDRAREVCPTFPGEGQQLHWGFPDPTAIDDPTERLAAFEDIAGRLRSRIGYFLTKVTTS
ncbi:MAG: ArsR family transcriptional regulator [Chloroflexi bacterium]|nr:ArsR family transcriptional regulator [Chloroflexota bacterium]MDL1883191.1 ArsR family transcriptional regulator [Anaerolineae bacterium CFX8]